MNIILFGPPGVGKSTLIGYLKSRGLRAIDLEDFYPNRIRFAIPNMVSDAFIGAADLSPQRKYPHALKVLLWMNQGAYDARRQYRDSKHPEKASQGKHDMLTWITPSTYDIVLNVEDTIDKTVESLLTKVLEVTSGK